MIGIMANAARHEPEAVAALRAGRDDKVNRLLRLPLPEPYVPTRLEAFRDRKRARPQPAAAAKAPKAPPARPPASRQRTRRAGGRSPNRRRGRRRPGRRPPGGAVQGIMDLASAASQAAGQRQTRRARALEGQRYG